MRMDFFLKRKRLVLVNYAEAESCDQAVKEMNGSVMKGIDIKCQSCAGRESFAKRKNFH